MDTGRRSSGVERRSVRHTRLARPAFWGGVLASVAVHGLVFGFARWSIPIVGEGSPASRALEVVALEVSPTAQPEPSAPRSQRALPARPSMTVDLPGIEARDVWAPVPGPDVQLARHAAPLPGVGEGRGRGVGDGAAGDGGDDFAPAVARSILPDWPVPRSIQGTVILARVYLDAFGNPTGAVELVPPTPDREVNRQIAERVRQLSYRPAMRNGELVPSWAEISFAFCPSGVTATSPPAPPAADPCSVQPVRQVDTG